jgi:hypothetical protein
MYFGLWFITIPLTILIIYTLITELLDLIFNSHKINKLLKYSDNLNYELLEQQYLTDKERQSKLNQSNLIELDRKIKYIRIVINNNSFTHRIFFEDKESIKAVKELSDIFKIK